jgi:hypothetical protein
MTSQPALAVAVCTLSRGQRHLWRKRSRPRNQLGYCARRLVAAMVRAARRERILARVNLAWLYGNIAGLVDVQPKALRSAVPAE